MHLRLTGLGNSSENQDTYDNKRHAWMHILEFLPITHNEMLPTLTGILIAALHSTILPLIAVLEFTIATAVEFN